MNNKITYHKERDYYIPNLYLEKEIYEKVKKRFQILMEQMLERNPIDENSKNTDTLKWVGLMNNYKHTAEEIIFRELIYC